MDKTSNLNGWSIYLRLLKYVKPYWHCFFISCTGMIMFALTEPAFAKLLEYFSSELSSTNSMFFLTQINWLNNGNGLASIWFIPILMFMIALCRSTGAFMGSYFSGKLSYSLIHDLRKQLFDKLLTLPCEFYNKYNSGTLISILISSVNNVTEAASEALRIIIREGLTVIFLFAFLFYTNWKMTLIFAVVIPFIAVTAMYASKRARRFSRNIQWSMAGITHVIKEAIAGQAEVKSYVARQNENQRFAAINKNNYWQTLKMDRSAFLNTAVLQILVAIALSLLLFIVLLAKGTINPSSLIGYVTAAALLPKPIKQLSDINAKIQKGISAAEIIFSLLDKPSEINRGNIISKKVTGAIKFENVNFSYPNTTVLALQNISFTIKPGQTIALVGRSGSGKTTLANLLSRFYLPTSGNIYIDGIDIQNYDLDFLRSQIAVVSQKVTLFSASVNNNIAYGINSVISEKAIKQAAVGANANDFIQNLSQGYESLIGENGTLLSGGQKQRLAIARAILKNSPIIVLDEATSSLDSDSENKIRAAINSIMLNKTTLVIAHRLSTIESADLVLVLDKGKIVEAGNHKQLLKNNLLYSQLYNLQFSNEKFK